MNNLELPKELKKSFKLEVEMAIYVPSTKDADKTISDAEFNRRVGEVEKYFSRLFGGETRVKSIGGYFSKEKNKVIKEKISKVYVFATIKDFNTHKKRMIKMVKFWAKKWKQESVGFEIEGDLYYVDA